MSDFVPWRAGPQVRRALDAVTRFPPIRPAGSAEKYQSLVSGAPAVRPGQPAARLHAAQAACSSNRFALTSSSRRAS